MTTANTLAALVNSSSQVVVPSGGINFGTSTDGTGTVISGVMDDYELGTFNVTFTASSSQTFTCYYVKIGNTVFFGNDTVVQSVGSGTSLTFSGNLPFTPNSGGTARFGLLRTVSDTPASDIMLSWNKDSAALYLYKMNNDDTSISGDTLTKDSRTDLYITFNGFFITD